MDLFYNFFCKKYVFNIREVEKKMEKINEGNCLKEGKCYCNCKIFYCFIIDEILLINVFCGVVVGVVGSVIFNLIDVFKVS